MKNRLAELERAEFFLAIKDRWNEKDYETDRQLAKEIRELKSKLAQEKENVRQES